MKELKFFLLIEEKKDKKIIALFHESWNKFNWRIYNKNYLFDDVILKYQIIFFLNYYECKYMEKGSE